MRAALWLVALAAGMLALAGTVRVALAAADVGQAAPALVVEEMDGQAFDLSARRGKVVIILARHANDGSFTNHRLGRLLGPLCSTARQTRVVVPMSTSTTSTLATVVFVLCLSTTC